jgi:hypothetical protein
MALRAVTTSLTFVLSVKEQQQHLLADTSNISVLARLLLPFCLAFT